MKRSFLRLLGKNPHLIHKALADGHPACMWITSGTSSSLITPGKILKVNQNLEHCITLE